MAFKPLCNTCGRHHHSFVSCDRNKRMMDSAIVFSREREKIEREGHAAGFAGVAKTSNPYSNTDYRSDLWNDAFDNGVKERR